MRALRLRAMNRPSQLVLAGSLACEVTTRVTMAGRATVVRVGALSRSFADCDGGGSCLSVE